MAADDSGDDAETSADLAASLAPLARRAPPPSLAARYEDVRFLGAGGMGTVYRGWDPRLGRGVAIKLLKGDDPSLARRSLQEARAQARVLHDNVCRVYEAGEIGGEPFIAMQLVDGEPLDRAAARMTLEQKVKAVREVAAAVHEAHRLGLVHRDIKPGNILVETGEDGVQKPYIMDFGLAREVSARGETMTGAVVGTPAFMAPEQARGEVRALDRRTDVYSLGATLYALLAGRPPFVAEHAWKLLLKVAYEEPAPLRRVAGDIPVDLETIVMKCLEREPGRRYESARALGEELQRFLDGEPIQARRASLGYVLWKKARKHRLATAVGAVVLLAALSLAGVWVKARREAAAQARLAQELGEDVKEMELFLRTAYELPLHDVERERDVVRARLVSIEERMAAAGRAGLGPGHYALGRGYLALGDPALSRAHLTQSVAAGYASAELDYALGRALGEVFKRSLDEARRIGNAEERKARIADLEVKLRDPALVRLRAAVGARIEVPAYAEGLIAFYEGKHDDALARAKEAFAAAPWLYEAKKLEGDAEFALGSQFRHDAAFDADKMMSHFGPAEEAYRAAAEIGRSDPEVHRAACELSSYVMVGTALAGKTASLRFEEGERACARAVQASSRDVRARVQRAFAHAMFANTLATIVKSPEDPLPVITRAVAIAEEVAQAAPDDVMARYVLANTLLTRAFHDLDRWQDAEDSTARAVEAYKAVLRIDGRFTWAAGDIILAYTSRVRWEARRGVDASASAEEAVAAAQRARAIDPGFLIALGHVTGARLLLADQLVERGLSPGEQIGRVIEEITEAQRLGLRAPTSHHRLCRAHILAAAYALSAGADPRAALDQAAREAEAMARAAPSSDFKRVYAVQIGLEEAELLLQTSQDPTPAIGEVQKANDALLASAPWELEHRLWRAQAQILALRWALRQHRATAAMFEAGFAPLLPLLDQERAYPRFYQALADLHALRAEWRRGRGERPDDDIEHGLAMADKALALNPHLGSAQASRGHLYLVRARTARDPDARKEAARQAKEAFAAALRDNPLLTRQEGDVAKEAEELL